MNNDFRKFATGHLGMNGLALDDVVKAQQQYLNPYILEERQLNVTQMDVFSRLMMDRIIFLGTEIDDYTANTLQAQLLYLDSVDNGKDISIYVNSPGGSVTAGLGIYDTMQFITSDVATICTGMAASMAAVLLVSGTEGKRSALPHSRVMIHQPLGGVQGQASDIEIEAREIQKFKKELYTIISNHSHQPYEKVWKDSDRNYWMTAEEAKEYGMIDTVLTRDCAVQAYKIVKDTGVLGNVDAEASAKSNEAFRKKARIPKPKEIKKYLDEYVIGQDEAKRYLSVASLQASASAL